MFEKLSWIARLGVVLSFLWLVFVYALSDQHSKGESFFIVGILPVALIWGAIWVVRGFLEQRRLKSLSKVKLSEGADSEIPEQKKRDPKKIISVVLVLLAAVITGWFYAGEQTARYVGAFFTYSLVAYFVSKFIPVAKPYAGTIATTVFAAGVVVSSFNHQREQNAVLTEWKNAAPVIAELQSGRLLTESELKQASLGRLEPVFRILISSTSEFASLWNAYLRDIEALNPEKLLSPSNLGSSAGRQSLRLNLTSLEQAINRLNENAVLAFQKFNTNIDSAVINLPATYANTFQNEFKKSTALREAEFRLLVKNQREMHRVLMEISNLVDQSKPVYGNGAAGINLYFQRQEDLNRYQSLSKRMLNIAAEEEKIVRQSQHDGLQRQKNFLEMLKKYRA
jgi:hypothetical protein